jgi:hypothetical protein
MVRGKSFRYEQIAGKVEETIKLLKLKAGDKVAFGTSDRERSKGKYEYCVSGLRTA